MGSIHRLQMTPAAWLAAIGLLAGSYDVTAISVLLVHLEAAWHLTRGQTANLTAAPLVGAVLGSLAAGILADRFGRRLLLLSDFATFVIAALLAATASGYSSLLLWRAVMGIGIGADFAVIFPYLAEMTVPAQRGATMALVLWISDIGQVLAYIAGSAFARVGAAGLRDVLLTGAALGVVTLISRRSLPEAAPWLRDRLPSFRAMVRKGFRRGPVTNAASSAVLWFLHQVTGQGLTLFLPLIIALLWAQGASQSGLTAAAVKALSLVGGALTIVVIDRWGRKRLQRTGFLGRGLALLPLGILVLTGARTPFWIAGGLLAVALGFGAMGPDKTTVIATSERFPTEIRATGQGSAEMIGRLGGVSGVLLFGLFAGPKGLAESLLVFAGVALLGALLTELTLPETAPDLASLSTDQVAS